MKLPECLRAGVDGKCSAKHRVDGRIYTKCKSCAHRRETVPLRLPDACEPLCLCKDADGKCNGKYCTTGALHKKCKGCAWRRENAVGKRKRMRARTGQAVSAKCKKCRYWRMLDRFNGGMACNFLLDENRMRGCAAGDCCTCFRPREERKKQPRGLTVRMG